jgi:hypothetical protein
MSEVPERIQVIRLGGLDNRIDPGTRFGTTFGIKEQPVFPADRKRADCSLGCRIVDRDLSIIQKNTEVFFLMDAVIKT